MNKYRQMAVKVVYLSLPLLKGDLRIDVRDSGRKNRQLNLWHAGIVATSGQKKQPSTEAKNVSFHFLSLPSVAGGIWSCEYRILIRVCRRLLKTKSAPLLGSSPKVVLTIP